MEAFIDGLGEWTWWIVAVALAILELLVPGIFFIWLAAAAALVGLVMLVLPVPVIGQVALFAILSVLAVYISRTWFQRHPISTDAPLLNQRAQTYVGKTYVLEQAIVNGRGKIKIGDTFWLVSGADHGAGASVRVTGERDGVLTVDVA
ncbi:MAG: NfeD family protein [Parvibaculaceae bacterium]